MAPRTRVLRPSLARDISVTRGSGNVFTDLGFDDAEELKVKALLTQQIAKRIQAMGLTQAQAGAKLRLSQPDVSKLVHGRFTGYSSDRLIAILNALDVDVEIVFRPRSLNGRRSRGRVRISRA